MTNAADIPTAHTPEGGYGEKMPVPVLAGCTEPLVEGAPDIGGSRHEFRLDRAG